MTRQVVIVVTLEYIYIYIYYMNSYVTLQVQRPSKTSFFTSLSIGFVWPSPVKWGLWLVGYGRTYAKRMTTKSEQTVLNVRYLHAGVVCCESYAAPWIKSTSQPPFDSPRLSCTSTPERPFGRVGTPKGFHGHRHYNAFDPITQSQPVVKLKLAP